MNTIPLSSAKWLVIRAGTSESNGRFKSTLEATEMHGDLDLLYFALGQNSPQDVAGAILNHTHADTGRAEIELAQAYIDKMKTALVAKELSK